MLLLRWSQFTCCYSPMPCSLKIRIPTLIIGACHTYQKMCLIVERSFGTLLRRLSHYRQSKKTQWTTVLCQFASWIKFPIDDYCLSYYSESSDLIQIVFVLPLILHGIAHLHKKWIYFQFLRASVPMTQHSMVYRPGCCPKICNV